MTDLGEDKDFSFGSVCGIFSVLLVPHSFFFFFFFFFRLIVFFSL